MIFSVIKNYVLFFILVSSCLIFIIKAVFTLLRPHFLGLISGAWRPVESKISAGRRNGTRILHERVRRRVEEMLPTSVHHKRDRKNCILRSQILRWGRNIVPVHKASYAFTSACVFSLRDLHANRNLISISTQYDAFDYGSDLRLILQKETFKNRHTTSPVGYWVKFILDLNSNCTNYFYPPLQCQTFTPVLIIRLLVNFSVSKSFQGNYIDLISSMFLSPQVQTMITFQNL